MEKENKKITNKSKSLKKSNDSDNSSSSKKSNDSDNSSSSKKSKSLKKSNDSDNSSSSKGFSKIYLLIGLILIIGVGIGLYFLLRDDSDDKDDKDDKDEEENKNDEEKDSSNKNKTSNNNTLIIVLSVIGFVYITGVLFAFYNNKGALSFASWFSLFFGSGKSSVEKRDSEKSEKKGSGKRDSEKLKDSEKPGVKLKNAGVLAGIQNAGGKLKDSEKSVKEKNTKVLEGIKKAEGKLKNAGVLEGIKKAEGKLKNTGVLEGIKKAGGKLKKATEKKLKERSEKKDTKTEIEEGLSQRRELAEARV